MSDPVGLAVSAILIGCAVVGLPLLGVYLLRRAIRYLRARREAAERRMEIDWEAGL